VPAGYQLVPIEPTKEMNAAGYSKNLELGGGKRNPADTYKAMLAAAPQPAEVAGERNYQHEANEWADAATNGLQWLRNVRDGVSKPADGIAEMEQNIKRIRAEFSTTAPKAPSTVTWKCSTSNKCDNCGHHLSAHAEQIYCPKAPASNYFDAVSQRGVAGEVGKGERPQWNFTARVADLIHLLQHVEIKTPTVGDAAQAVSAINDIRTMLAEQANYIDVFNGLATALPKAPEAVPLSDEEIKRLWRTLATYESRTKDAIVLARAIEAAHGITPATTGEKE